MDLRVILCVMCIFQLVMFVSLYLTCRYYDDRLLVAEEKLLNLQRRLEQLERKQGVRGDPDIVQQGWRESPADTAVAEVDREKNEPDGDSLAFLTQLGETRGPYVRSKRKAKDRERRGKRNKNKKCGRSKRKCPSSLPSIQVEGVVGTRESKNKHDQESYWTAADWVKSAKDEYFSIELLDSKGHIRIEADGLYIVYAQINLYGEMKRGYHVNVIQNGSSSVVATCELPFLKSADGELPFVKTTGGETCTTFKIVRLSANDVIYYQELSSNSGANYSNTYSFFGLIKIGN